MPINILMPALSPTMTEGNVSKWLKKEGDTVKAGDVLAEIETDKATMEVEAVDEGKLGKIIVAAGTEGVKVNDVIAVLLEEGESAADIAGTPKSNPEPAAKTADAKPKAEAPAPQPAAPKPAAAPAAPSGDGKRVFASPLARRIAEQQGIDLGNVQGSGPNGRIVRADLDNAPRVRRRLRVRRRSVRRPCHRRRASTPSASRSSSSFRTRRSARPSRAACRNRSSSCRISI